MAHIYKEGPNDYRVTVRVDGKYRDVGGVFTTREAARDHLKTIEKPKDKKR